MTKKKKQRKKPVAKPTKPRHEPLCAGTLAQLDELPTSYQALSDFLLDYGEVNLFPLRKETFLRIESITGRPLLCYVTKTHNVAPGIGAYIDDSDLTGLNDLMSLVDGNDVDVFLMSNGGSAEATERIVDLLRGRFRSIRYIIPGNAYSAATLLCFSGNEILMGRTATLGPIDPQIRGVPAIAIIRAFEAAERHLRADPNALAAYLPLLEKYDLEIFEICKAAQALSEELAKRWLSAYMFKCDEDNSVVRDIVEFFTDYDTHKSHGRSVNREVARRKGLNVRFLEDIEGLPPLIRSLNNQYQLWFSKTLFYKLFEDARGINWGHHTRTVTVQLPFTPQPILPPPTEPGPPERSQ